VTTIDSFEQEKGLPIEYSIFALCFKEEGAIEFFAENLSPDIVGAIHGETGIHEFYKAILGFYSQMRIDPIDVTAFRSWLEESDIYLALGGEPGVRAFLDLIMDAELSDKRQLLKVLTIKANQRKQLTMLQELQQLVSKKGARSQGEISQITELTEHIRSLENQLDLNPLDFVTTGEDMIFNIDNLLDIPNFIPTQFPELNRAMGYTATGGFFRGAVHGVLAASGLGKSTFCKSLCNFWLDEGYTVLYVNFEEAQGHWERVLFSQIIGHNVYRDAERWTPAEREGYTKVYRDKLEEWGSRLMVRHDPDTPYFDDLEMWFRDIIGHNDILPDIVVIDTIQSMFTKGSNRPRWAEFEQMMVRLEKLAREMDCALIITAQENANRMKEKREVVLLSDTGGSLAIQQKCAVTMFITSLAAVRDDDSIDASLMQLQIPKNRITGGVFSMDPPIVRYDDESKSYVPWNLAANNYSKNNKNLLKDIDNL